MSKQGKTGTGLGGRAGRGGDLGRRGFLQALGLGGLVLSGCGPKAPAVPTPKPLLVDPPTPSPYQWLTLLRPEDLVSLYVGLINVTGNGEAIWPSDPASARLLFLFPRQHLLEPALDEPPAGQTAAVAAPLDTRIAGLSRVVLAWPEDVGKLALRTDELLRALQTFPIAVSPLAVMEGEMSEEVGPPRQPDRAETSLELPFRLLMSPHRHVAFVNRASPASPGDWVELWHARMAVRTGLGLVERDHKLLTLRALYSRDLAFAQGKPSDTMSTFSRVTPETSNFDNRRGALRDGLGEQARAKIVEQTGIDRQGSHPARVDGLTLSSLGASFDARGDWFDSLALPCHDRPGTTLARWRHRAAQGRDLYVETVYRGRLYPLGHTAYLVTITERKPAGTHAALLLRQFLTIEPVQTYDDEAGRAFPFARVEMLETTTGNLAPPPLNSPKLFVPTAVGASDPYLFGLKVTDRAGREHRMSMHLVWTDEFECGASTPQNSARQLYKSQIIDQGKADRPMQGQRVAYAAPSQPDEGLPAHEDTAFPTETLRVIGSQDNSGKLLPPQLESAKVAIEAVQQLTGSAAPVLVQYCSAFVAGGFSKDNQNEGLFAIVKRENGSLVQDQLALALSGGNGAVGGLLSPDLALGAVSRNLGPLAMSAADTADKVLSQDPDVFLKQIVDSFLNGTKLFGVLSLKSVLPSNVQRVIDEAPKLISKVTGEIGALISNVLRVKSTIEGFLALIANAADSDTLDETKIAPLIEAAYGALPADVKNKISSTISTITQFLQKIVKQVFDVVQQITTAVTGAVKTAQQAVDTATDAVNKAVDAASNVADSIDAQANASISKDGDKDGLADQAWGLLMSLYDALEGKDTTVPGSAVAYKLGAPLAAELGKLKVFGDGLRRDAERILEDIRGFIARMKEKGEALFRQAMSLYARGQELARTQTLSLDWRLPLSPVALFGSDDDPKQQVFRGIGGKNPQLVLAVEARAKGTEAKPAGIDVLSSLEGFELRLIAPYTFFSLGFKRCQVKLLAGKKPDVDVVFGAMNFEGPLSFLNALKGIIPLNGFSDPPSLSVSARGIVADFSLALPNIAIGVFSLDNLALSAGFTVPFVGDPLSVRFAFCSRDNPFHLTVSMLGGGGFFALEITPAGLKTMEAALEFGAALSIDFGVASGSVSCMGGIYFKMERSTDSGGTHESVTLTGYFRLRGKVSVLGLISASLELYLALQYVSVNGQSSVTGEASLVISVSVLFFSASVEVHCQRTFSGCNGDPTFEDLMKPTVAELPLESLSDEQWPWRAYQNAFAA